MRIYMKYLFNEIHNKKIPCKTYYIYPSQSFAIYLLALKFEMADSLSIQTFDHPHTSPPHPTPTLIDDAREWMVVCCNTKCV